MPTTRDQAHSRAVHQEQRCAQWLRIVSYVLAACRLLKSAPTTNIRRRLRKASPSRGEDRTSHHSRENTRQRLASAVFAFQILKIVLLRASEDLQDAPTRVWTFIGAGLRDLLEEGNADFLIRANEGSPSPSPSRPVTPGEAAHTSDNVLLRPNDGQRSPVSPMGESHPSQSRPPRAIDYLLWTILELVTSHATPLMHQMRVFVQEKIKQTNQVISRIDHRMSRSPKRASVFLRPKLNGSPDLNASPQPRQSMLKWSPTSTPSPSPSKVMTNSYFSVEATTPSPLRTHGTRIVHLGPVNLPANSEEQGGTGIGAHRLSSDSLATATVRAMQAVRLTMGYATLEVPTDRYNTLQINFIPWTRASALARVIEETSVFIDWEFRSELLAQAPLRSDSFSHPAHSPINQEK